MSGPLDFRPARPGQLECSLDLSRLFATKKEQQKFREKWPAFLASDKTHADLYELKGSRLNYLSEQLLPERTDDRPPLLLVLGNPASHSVQAGMFFSFEADGREHRFWKNILQPAGVVDLSGDANAPVERRNDLRRKRLLELDYPSPFRLGLTVFISLPSPASGAWSGMAGVRQLLGGPAMALLEEAEWERVLQCARSFLQPRGRAAVFQKDAWDSLRLPDDPPYRREAAAAGELVGRMRGLPTAALIGIPPTRLSGPARKVLAERVVRGA